ncbi:MAG: hypothetical protein WBA74_04210 [Cyclobacteriaceae bacterium]
MVIIFLTLNTVERINPDFQDNCKLRETINLSNNLCCADENNNPLPRKELERFNIITSVSTARTPFQICEDKCIDGVSSDRFSCNTNRGDNDYQLCLTLTTPPNDCRGRQPLAISNGTLLYGYSSGSCNNKIECDL